MDKLKVNPKVQAPNNRPNEQKAGRRTILARRAKFVAMTLTSVGLATGCKPAEPCLRVGPLPVDSNAPANTVSSTTSEQDATVAPTAPTATTSKDEAGDTLAPPRKCLSMLPLDPPENK